MSNLKKCGHMSWSAMIMWVSQTDHFRRVRKFSKSDYKLRHVCPSVRMEQLGLPLDGFSWYLIFEYYPKICWKKSSFIGIWQDKRLLYMKTNVRFSSYLAQQFLEWEMFPTKLQRKSRQILWSITFFENLFVSKIMWRNAVEPGRPQKTTWRMHDACWLPKSTNIHSQYVIRGSYRKSWATFFCMRNGNSRRRRVRW